jgi:hypothetical protein
MRCIAALLSCTLLWAPLMEAVLEKLDRELP